MGQPRTVEAAILALLGAFSVLLFLRPIWDIDIFWHLAAGRWMWEHGSLPSTDIFGLDPAREWISFQAGYQLLVYGIERAGGLGALRVAHACVMVVAFALLYRVCRRHLGGPGGLFLAPVVLWLLTLLLFQDRINVRPHVFNLLGLAIVLPALLGGWRTASLPACAGWACWFGVWANLHAGGCLLMLGVMAAIPAGALLEPGRPAWRRALLLWTSCAALPVLSPSFLTGSFSALALVRTTGDLIGEWSAPIAYVLDLHDPGFARVLAGLLPYFTLFVLGGVTLCGGLRGRDPSVAAAAVALTALSLLYVRFVHFAAPVWLILAGWYLPRLRDRLEGRYRAAAAGAAAVALCWITWDTSVTRLFGGPSGALRAIGADIDERRFPVEAASFLDVVGFEGTIFCHARYGGYLLWRLHPRVRTAMDGRSNVEPSLAMDVAFVHEHHRSQHADSAAAARIVAIFDRYATDALVLESPAFAPGRLDCRRWLPVFRTPKLEVYLRNDEANAANLFRAGVHRGGAGACGAGTER